MTNVSVREIRQNPSAVVSGLEAGEAFTLTSYNRPIGRIEPILTSATLIPPSKPGIIDLVDRKPHKLRSAESIDALLDDMKGER